MADNADDKKCIWGLYDGVFEEGYENTFDTTCGHTFVLDSGRTKDNGLEYCCFCGRELKEDMVSEDDD